IVFIVLLAIYFVLFLVFVIVRRKMLTTPAETSVPNIAALSTQAKAIFVASALLYVAFFVASFSTRTMANVTSPVIMLLVSAIWVTAGFVIVVLGHRWGMPLFTFFIVFALLISPLADNHVLRTLPAPATSAARDCRPVG